VLKIILIVVVVIIVAVLILAATRPDTFRLERRTSIKAPPEKVFALINDFHNWPAWSPWEKMDPALKRTYSGAPNGKGAVYAWEGNSKVGSGSMEITDTSPPGRIVIRLDFMKPFEAHNVAEFILVPTGDSTELTWAMHGPLPYLAKIMHLFFSMDRMVGGQFEEGLANLKANAEAGK
jgi:uncharacterized protein YndB with AHSA1/START domain